LNEGANESTKAATDKVAHFSCFILKYTYSIQFRLPCFDLFDIYMIRIILEKVLAVLGGTFTFKRDTRTGTQERREAVRRSQLQTKWFNAAGELLKYLTPQKIRLYFLI